MNCDYGLLSSTILSSRQAHGQEQAFPYSNLLCDFVSPRQGKPRMLFLNFDRVRTINHSIGNQSTPPSHTPPKDQTAIKASSSEEHGLLHQRCNTNISNLGITRQKSNRATCVPRKNQLPSILFPTGKNHPSQWPSLKHQHKPRPSCPSPSRAGLGTIYQRESTRRSAGGLP